MSKPMIPYTTYCSGVQQYFDAGHICEKEVYSFATYLKQLGAPIRCCCFPEKLISWATKVNTVCLSLTENCESK